MSAATPNSTQRAQVLSELCWGFRLAVSIDMTLEPGPVRNPIGKVLCTLSGLEERGKTFPGKCNKLVSVLACQERPRKLAVGHVTCNLQEEKAVVLAGHAVFH